MEWENGKKMSSLVGIVMSLSRNQVHATDAGESVSPSQLKYMLLVYRACNPTTDYDFRL